MLQSEDLRERRHAEPRRGEDVGAALALEEEGEPEGERGAVGGLEGWDRALLVGKMSAATLFVAEVIAKRDILETRFGDGR